MSEALPQRNGTYLRQHQIEELSHEKEQLEKQLGNPHIQDRPAVFREIRKIARILETEAPPDLNPSQRDSVAREEKRLRAAITEDMLSGEEMRKAPPGAVGRLLAFEKKHKQNILRWKNCVLALRKGDPNPDVANLEQYRPATRPSDPAMHGALIPGKTFSFPSEQYRENYDAIDFASNKKALADLLVQGAQDPEIRQAMKDLLAETEPKAEPEPTGEAPQAESEDGMAAASA